MKLGRVIGSLVATVKVDGMDGLKLLIVRPLKADLSVEGDPFVATDASAQASTGALVTYEASREAALLHDPWFIPVDHAIVGIVDQHDYDGDAEMILGRVCGTVVSTVQHSFYDGRKQLIVRAVTPDGEWDGERYVVAVDLVGAGIGETVVVQDEGNSARQLLDAKNGPVRSVIVGIVDEVG